MMLTEACAKAVIGLSALVDAIAALEKELTETQLACQELERRAERLGERIQVLEETSAADGIDVELIDRILENYDLESKIETIVEDKIESALDMRLDDAIESAMSGREVEINFNGTVTL